MRPVLFAGLAVTGLAFVALSTSPGFGRTRIPAIPQPQDLYCLQGRIWGYPGNCQFATYEQCSASASGTNAYCDVNPQYLFARGPRGYWPSR
jgi:hypothetical protein